VAKGILLEVEGRWGVVLTPAGEFKRIPIPRGSGEVGDEITFAEGVEIAWAKWIGVAVAAAIMLVAPLGYQQWTLAQPFAIVTIDINPSLQLTLNNRNDVIRVEGLNADGTLVLQGLSWKSKSVDEVISAVTDRAVEIGKLNPAEVGSSVVVAVAPAKSIELKQSHAEELVTRSKDAVVHTVTERAKGQQKQVQTTVGALSATVKERDDAKENGLDAGQFLMLEKLRERLPDLTPADIKKAGPGGLIRSLKLDLKSEIEGAEQQHSPSSDRGRPTLPALGNPVAPGQGNQGKSEDQGNKENQGNNGNRGNPVPEIRPPIVPIPKLDFGTVFPPGRIPHKENKESETEKGKGSQRSEAELSQVVLGQSAPQTIVMEDKSPVAPSAVVSRVEAFAALGRESPVTKLDPKSDQPKERESGPTANAADKGQVSPKPWANPGVHKGNSEQPKPEGQQKQDKQKEPENRPNQDKSKDKP